MQCVEEGWLIEMTKVEKERCEKLMEEAIQKAEQAKEEFNKARSEKDVYDLQMLMESAQNHLGYAEGINQTLACIGFKHEWMKELGNLLQREWLMKMKVLINSAELAKRIFDCISDGYDDEENREEAEMKLYNELSQIDNNSIIKNAFVTLCERIEDLEIQKGLLMQMNTYQKRKQELRNQAIEWQLDFEKS